MDVYVCVYMYNQMIDVFLHIRYRVASRVREKPLQPGTTCLQAGVLPGIPNYPLLQNRSCTRCLSEPETPQQIWGFRNGGYRIYGFRV